MRQVKPGNIHAALNHFEHGFNVITGRTDGGNDLGFTECGLAVHNDMAQG
jgi:hypothetical protein